METKSPLKTSSQLQLDSLNPATRLLEQRRKMYEIQEEYEKEKKEFAKKEEDFKLREQKLRDKDGEIQESLVKFSNFLKENESKKARNLERKTQEEAEMAIKTEELKKIETKVAELTAQASLLTKSILAKKKYEEFLEKAKNKNQDEFKDIDDILSRYYTLTYHKESMEKTKSELENKIAQTKSEINTYNSSSNNQKYELETHISNLREETEIKERNSQEKQKEFDVISKKATMNEAKLTQILLSIDNIFNRCRKRKEKSYATHQSTKETAEADFTKKTDTAKKQLEEIKSSLDDFHTVYMEISQSK